MSGNSIVNRMVGKYLPRSDYSIIRISGQGFKEWTKNLDKPFDQDFVGLMDAVSVSLCEEIKNAVFAYVQSDEVSILLFHPRQKEKVWLNGDIQRMASVSASIATAKFNDSALDAFLNGGVKKFFNMELALFESMTFPMPSKKSIEDYFIWRQKKSTESNAGLNTPSDREKNGGLVMFKVERTPDSEPKISWTVVNAPLFNGEAACLELLIPTAEKT